MNRSLQTLFTPAEFDALRDRDLSRTTCVVFDILRATTSMVTAIQSGAEAIIPVSEIDAALAIRSKHPDVLLAGERDGYKICRALTGSIDFDLGKLSVEFIALVGLGVQIAMTLSNGTRALIAGAHAAQIFVGALLNMSVLTRCVIDASTGELLVICAGTHDQSALEDVLAAGALANSVWKIYEGGRICDSTLIAREKYLASKSCLTDAIAKGRNGRRLLGIPELHDDVAYCSQVDTCDVVCQMTPDGVVQVQHGTPR